MANTQKTALILGGGGFIGGHLINRLKQEGYWVRSVDLKRNPWGNDNADEVQIADLRNRAKMSLAVQHPEGFDWIINLCADMGGAGYINTGDNDANVVHNSCLVTLNLLDVLREFKEKNLFTKTPVVGYSSSACVYNEHNQVDPLKPVCIEGTEYPAFPDTEYGWEKLFAERLYLTYNRIHNIPVKIARFHNIFGENTNYDGGREKAPAALCRKVIQAEDGGTIDIWGDGNQTRSFLHVSQCVEGLIRLMGSDFKGPVNIGSDYLISINDLVDLIADIGGKVVNKNHIKGPQGVRGRNSDNKLINQKLGWKPNTDLRWGIERMYSWILEDINRKKI